LHSLTNGRLYSFFGFLEFFSIFLKCTEVFAQRSVGCMDCLRCRFNRCTEKLIGAAKYAVLRQRYRARCCCMPVKRISVIKRRVLG